MASFNKVTLVGYLGRDPELRYTAQGTAVCNLSIATSEKRRDTYGDQREITTWFRVTVWGKQAELCDQWLRKGSQAYIEGQLRLAEYTSREGEKRFSLEVSASDVKFLGARERGQGEGSQRASEGEESSPTRSSPRTERNESREPSWSQQNLDDTDIPF